MLKNPTAPVSWGVREAKGDRVAPEDTYVQPYDQTNDYAPRAS